MSISTTTNYEMFQLLDFNRDVTKTRKLELSMKKHGYINAYPLHVVKENGKLKIKGGHHRFSVAVKLGLPVAYVVCSDNASIHELEAATVKWDMDDYLTSFSRLGDADYIAVLKCKQRTGISTGMCVSMLGGEMAMSGNKRELFKSGEFTITDTTHADIVADLVMTLKKAGITWASDRLSVGTLSRIVSAGHADISRLKNKIKSNPSLIQKKVNFNQYMEMWEEVYNRQVHGKKTPLTFLTNETIKERSLDLIAKLSGK